MFRELLSETDWQRLESGLRSLGLYKTPKLRLTLEGILWRTRTGAPWRDLPSELGSLGAVFTVNSIDGHVPVNGINFSSYFVGKLIGNGALWTGLSFERINIRVVLSEAKISQLAHPEEEEPPKYICYLMHTIILFHLKLLRAKSTI